MKKNLLLSFLLLVSSALIAQDTSLLERFYKGVSQSCVEIAYSYSARVSGIDNTGEGVIAAQGMRWKMTGNGVEMYCDSVSLWVIDPSLREAVIEPAFSDAESQYLTNPAILFVQLKNLFDVRESRDATGGDSVLYILSPKAKGKIDYFNVELSKADAHVRNASFAMSDGTLVKIKVSSMKLTPLRPAGHFRPDKMFDASWIVTDLR